MQRKRFILLLFLIAVLTSIAYVSCILRFSVDILCHFKSVSVNDFTVTWVENGSEVAYIDFGTLFNFDNKTAPLINVTSTADVPIWLSVFTGVLGAFDLKAWVIEKEVDIATRGLNTPTVMLLPNESVTLEFTLTTEGCIIDHTFQIELRAYDIEVS